jgi:hypothetical protein
MTPLHRRSLLLVGIIGAATACGGGEPGSDEMPSAPVRLEEIARLGCGVCGGAEQLAVASVAVSSSGEIYVTDRFEPFIRVFDAEGDLRTSFGSAGEGPGEMGSRLPGVPMVPPIGLYLDGGDGLLVHDLMPPRLARFGRRGEYIETTRLDAELRFLAGRAFDPLEGYLYVASYQLRMFSESPGSSIHRFDPADGEAATVLSGAEFPIESTEAGAPNHRYPFAATAGRFAIGDPQRYLVYTFDPDGAPVGRFGRDLPLPEKTAEELERERAQLEAASQRSGRPAAEPDPHKPHFLAASFDYDDRGHLWVQTTRGRAEETIFDVFDDAGELLGEITAPVEVNAAANPLDKMFDAEGDYLAAATTDAEGNDTVIVWRVVWR